MINDRGCCKTKIMRKDDGEENIWEVAGYSDLI